MAKNTLKKKNKVEVLTFPNFKTYYKTIIIKMVLYWNIDQRARIESPGTHPCVSGQMIFDKGPKTTQQGEDSLFNNWC